MTSAVLHVRVITGPGLVADPRLLAEVADREFAALGVRGTLSPASGPAAVQDALAGGAASSDVLVVLPGPDPGIRALIPAHPGAVWLDLTRADPVPAGTFPGRRGASGETGETVHSTHLHGRGVWGLAWAIRHAVHRRRRPARRVAYGAHPDQWAEVRLPPGPRADPAANPETSPETGPDPAAAPTAVLLHGGYWRSVWGADLMDALCADLAARGFASWNLEYRRPDLHGWAATTGDVAAGVALAARGARGPVVLIGHSAGGQLALRAAADDRRVTLAVSLAGVLDLAEGDRRHLSSGAVAAALGGSVAEAPDVYARSSPMERLPLGVPQLVVQGDGDDLDLVDLGRRYARAAREAGDDVTYLEMAGDHFDVIDPASPIWRATATEIAAVIAAVIAGHGR
ncbi:alpha/beta hydrolase fold domain-containing protein [Planomonospora sp. ID67723]|uniref:alpha/beta hydrolase family protein n=1 Tax=Planomonospora sp. ID67723 TaxID=2738134 RepID=UPI001A2C0B97|nr:alpha/beta fold hydrolase [Planomonospora sp. ID67723]MBG0831159.1 alpha/beta hydrolase fold domain-containing protein [Planomonospora sp. ID67723]